MGYTDVGDSLEEMKLRAAYRHFNFPYLYDGETQKVSRAYGPSATPHLFIFDAERKLRYQGRVDNNPRERLVTSRDARDAIEALLRTNRAMAPSYIMPCSEVSNANLRSTGDGSKDPSRITTNTSAGFS